MGTRGGISRERFFVDVDSFCWYFLPSYLFAPSRTSATLPHQHLPGQVPPDLVGQLLRQHGQATSISSEFVYAYNMPRTVTTAPSGIAVVTVEGATTVDIGEGPYTACVPLCMVAQSGCDVVLGRSLRHALLLRLRSRLDVHGVAYDARSSTVDALQPMFITELIIGYTLPSRPVATIMFTTWESITMAQALTFTSDCKLGYYMKFPPHPMFWCQVITTAGAGTVQLHVQSWVFTTIVDICTKHQKDSFSCSNMTVDHLGLYRPARIFSAGQLYNKLMWLFLIGADVPILSYSV
ncbi:hypothetical protein NM688_g2219 [Phlebia brevispora]|uniref:Uncharacterized protein n=1 Tax=Phlebia brevispora TaxID=194682 RepID=A0ACC1T902_9APHY|nr:hypothetical protein NM688_g2219 [Phlebia brevispora]